METKFSLPIIYSLIILHFIFSSILSSASCFTASLFLIGGWWTGWVDQPRLISEKPQLQIVVYSVILAVSTIKLSMRAFNQVHRKCQSDYWKIFEVSTDPASLESQSSNGNEIELQVC